MPEYVVEITPAGFDVDTALDKEFSFSSRFPFLKAYLQGSMSVEVTADDTYVSVFNHALGYVPAYLTYSSYDPANPQDRRTGVFAADGITGGLAFTTYVDEDDLTIAWTDTTGGEFAPYPYTVGFYYYLFYDELS